MRAQIDVMQDFTTAKTYCTRTFVSLIAGSGASS
jgi:hypothetical protein